MFSWTGDFRSWRNDRAIVAQIIAEPIVRIDTDNYVGNAIGMRTIIVVSCEIRFLHNRLPGLRIENLSYLLHDLPTQSGLFFALKANANTHDVMKYWYAIGFAPLEIDRLRAAICRLPNQLASGQPRNAAN